MACAGSHCNYHSTGTSTCVGHRPPNSPAGGVVAAPAVGQVVTAAKINELRNAIRTEVSRWTLHGCYGGVYYGALATNIAVGTVVDDDSTVDVQDDGLVRVGGSGYPGTVTHPNHPGQAAISTPAGPDVSPALPNNTFSPGVNITVANYNTILNSYNQLRVDCICNSDCNCNAVCACHNDCGCNYSDMRLKKEIVYC